MKHKDLAKEYLDRKIKQEPFKSLTKGFEYAFSVDDIKAAFNAGRDSVVAFYLAFCGILSYVFSGLFG